VGLCNTLSIEGGKNNINCNVIIPTAASRLTEDILPPGIKLIILNGVFHLIGISSLYNVFKCL